MGAVAWCPSRFSVIGAFPLHLSCSDEITTRRVVVSLNAIFLAIDALLYSSFFTLFFFRSCIQEVVKFPLGAADEHCRRATWGPSRCRAHGVSRFLWHQLVAEEGGPAQTCTRVCLWCVAVVGTTRGAIHAASARALVQYLLPVDERLAPVRACGGGSHHKVLILHIRTRIWRVLLATQFVCLFMIR